MRRLLLSLGTIALLVSSAGTTCAQGNPRGLAKLTLNGQNVSVEYGRPRLKGRTVQQLLGQLGGGQVWRLGADSSTTFEAGVDLAFGNVAVPKGKYSLWARKDADGWKLVFNKQHGQWGTQHNASLDFADVPLKESKASKAEEMVTISLAKEGDGGAIAIQWGDMILSTNFKAT